MKPVLRGAAIAGVLCSLAACGQQDTLEPAAPTVGVTPMTLAQLSVACEASASKEADGVGVVKLRGDLRDANSAVRIGQPCLIELAATSRVQLNNVQVTSSTLNIDDLGAAAGTNQVQLQRVTFTGVDSGAGLVVSLSDPTDTLRTEASSLSYPAGIAIEVAGTRDQDNSGGDIALINSQLAASGAQGHGVSLTASEHTGRFEAVGTSITTPANILTVAGVCSIKGKGKPIDCSTSAVADDLKRQAELAETLPDGA